MGRWDAGQSPPGWGRGHCSACAMPALPAVCARRSVLFRRILSSTPSSRLPTGRSCARSIRLKKQRPRHKKYWDLRLGACSSLNQEAFFVCPVARLFEKGQVGGKAGGYEAERGAGPEGEKADGGKIE